MLRGEGTDEEVEMMEAVAVGGGLVTLAMVSAPFPIQGLAKGPEMAVAFAVQGMR